MRTMEPAADPRPQAAPGAPGAAGLARPRKTATRKLRNYLLDTSLQLTLASYLVAVAARALGLGWLLLWTRVPRDEPRVWRSGSRRGDTLAAALAAEDRGRIVLVAAALAVASSCLLVAAVVVTHRIAGPAFVIRRDLPRWSRPGARAVRAAPRRRPARRTSPRTSR